MKRPLILIGFICASIADLIPIPEGDAHFVCGSFRVRSLDERVDGNCNLARHWRAVRPGRQSDQIRQLALNVVYRIRSFTAGGNGLLGQRLGGAEALGSPMPSCGGRLQRLCLHGAEGPSVESECNNPAIAGTASRPCNLSRERERDR